MNEFVSWCRHLLVSFLFHALTSLHPPSFYRNDFSTCVYTDGGNGRDSRECLTHNSIREPCRTLIYVADNLESASVDIYVLSDCLNLTDAVEFNDFQHLQISGNKSTINCPETNAGIAFIHIRELDIMSLSIEGCGAERNSTNVNLEKNVTEPVDVAVYIVNCTDVAINNLNVSASNGKGLSVYDTNGTVSITNCLFDGNHFHTNWWRWSVYRVHLL